MDAGAGLGVLAARDVERMRRRAGLVEVPGAVELGGEVEAEEEMAAADALAALRLDDRVCLTPNVGALCPPAFATATTAALSGWTDGLPPLKPTPGPAVNEGTGAMP